MRSCASIHILRSHAARPFGSQINPVGMRRPRPTPNPKPSKPLSPGRPMPDFLMRTLAPPLSPFRGHASHVYAMLPAGFDSYIIGSKLYGFPVGTEAPTAVPAPIAPNSALPAVIPFMGLWTAATAFNNDAFQHAVFALRLRTTPPLASRLLHTLPGDHDWATTLHQTMPELWELQVLQCMHTIWRWRLQCPQDHVRWTPQQARAMARSALLAAVATVQRGTRFHGHPALLHQVLKLYSSSLGCSTVPPSPSPAAHYLLYFDGGSMGNPGPGGAGAVVVRIDASDATAQLVWSAAMSLARQSTPNNYAEYVGLLTGLQAASQQRWSPLTVIGDSHLIIRQLAFYPPPRSERLRPLYILARLLADRLTDVAWRHHLRAYNKMADHAANVTMDSKCSLQTFHPSERPEWRGLDHFLQGDVAHWRAS